MSRDTFSPKTILSWGEPPNADERLPKTKIRVNEVMVVFMMSCETQNAEMRLLVRVLSNSTVYQATLYLACFWSWFGWVRHILAKDDQRKVVGKWGYLSAIINKQRQHPRKKERRHERQSRQAFTSEHNEKKSLVDQQTLC